VVIGSPNRNHVGDHRGAHVIRIEERERGYHERHTNSVSSNVLRVRLALERATKLTTFLSTPSAPPTHRS
jgi:hypothetical protein